MKRSVSQAWKERANVLIALKPEYKNRFAGLGVENPDIGTLKEFSTPSPPSLQEQCNQYRRDAEAKSIQLLKLGIAAKYENQGDNGSAWDAKGAFPTLFVQLGAVGYETVEWAKITITLLLVEKLQTMVFVDSILGDALDATTSHPGSSQWRTALALSQSSLGLLGRSDISAGNAHLADFPSAMAEAERVSGKRLEPLPYLLTFCPIQSVIQANVLGKVNARAGRFPNIMGIGLKLQTLWPNIYNGRSQQYAIFLKEQGGRHVEQQTYSELLDDIRGVPSGGFDFSSADPVAKVLLEICKAESSGVTPQLTRVIDHITSEVEKAKRQ